MDEAALERYAEAAWNLRCERSAQAKERPSGISTWEDRAPFLREIDKAVASLVADMAAHDERMRIVAEIRKHASVWPPGFQRNLVHSAADAVAREGQERSDEKEAG